MMSKKIVDLHRGELQVNTAPGAGTTISIRLPDGKEPLPKS